ISQRREDLLRIAADFRRNYYDDPRSIFIPGRDGQELDDILDDLLGGAIAGADYWDRARRQHRWDDRPADPCRRSSRLPPWQGGFDPWGNGPEDDFGHDEDFRTEGGF
ncbi:MAG: hypothetical protein ACR2PG_08680, partial [Hyphomicrobiaceae bacterium]